MTSIAASIAGWSYLPDFATRQLLPYFHKLYQSVTNRPPPPQNTPLYYRHYRYVYAFVVLSYLLYNFREAALAMTSNYYEILGVSPSADESTLKSAFRQFARKNHPDRVGPQGEVLFMEVRDAFEALKNPVTRFAYDRFGPNALSWKQCTTLREYIRHGLMQSVGYHIVSACALLLFSAIGRPSPVAFWRYLLFASLFAYELVFLLSPSPSNQSTTTLSNFLFSNPASPSHGSIFSFIWPNRVAYQHIRFLHSLFMLLSVALSRVAPVLFPSPSTELMDAKRLTTELGRLNALAQAAEQEASAMTHIELHSCHGESTGAAPTGAIFPHVPPIEKPTDTVMSLLTQEMENMVIEGKILRETGPMKSAVENVVERRKRLQESNGKSATTSTGGDLFSSPVRIPITPSRRTGIAERRPFGATPGPPDGKLTEGVGYVRARSQSLS